MKRLFKYVLAFIIFSSILGCGTAGKKVYYPPDKVKNFAEKFEKTLKNKNAEAAIVAGVGIPREKLPKGINYTHTAFAVYSDKYTIYNLYQKEDKPNMSELVQNLPIEFLTKTKVLKEGIAIIIPSYEFQKKLLKVLNSSFYKDAHTPRYSLIANPFTLKYQNCTEHSLDIITAAIFDTRDIKKIKEYEKKYFEPNKLSVPRILIFIKSLFDSELALSDHEGTPVTATFTTIKKFVKKYDPQCQTLILYPDK